MELTTLEIVIRMTDLAGRPGLATGTYTVAHPGEAAPPEPIDGLIVIAKNNDSILLPVMRGEPKALVGAIHAAFRQMRGSEDEVARNLAGVLESAARLILEYATMEDADDTGRPH